MARGARKANVAVRSVLEEAEQNLQSAFKKSSLTEHRVLKGDARAESIAEFLRQRLPSAYGVLCRGEIVDYLDHRSSEIDVLIFDQVRNAVMSDDPLWVPAEALLAYIEVKSILTEDELRKAYLAAKKVSALKPFKCRFTLADSPTTNSHYAPNNSLRCFRTLFAYDTNLKEEGWLDAEWSRVTKVTGEIGCVPGLIDRILVLSRGMLNPPSASGTGQSTVSPFFGQWFVNLVNFLTRENSRRPSVDWQIYSKKHIPGWRSLS